MKQFLFIILLVVAAVLLWAIRTEAYANNPLVFSLGLVAAALSGYLIADYFAKMGKQTLANNLQVAHKENQALRERADLLKTQFNTATPHAETAQFEERIALLSDEKNKIDGMSRAQTAEIANLKEKLDGLQKSHAKISEDAMIATETAHTQALTMQEELVSTKLKIKDLTDENTALREHNVELTAKIDAKNTEIDPDTEGVIGKIVSEKTDAADADSTNNRAIGTSDFSETLDNQSLVAERDFMVTELEPEDTAVNTFDAGHYGSSDNLQAIEGIGPKVETALKAAGCINWEKLSMATPERLQVILDASGKQFKSIDPTSWPEQARLLVHKEFAKLKKYKEYIGWIVAWLPNSDGKV